MPIYLSTNAPDVIHRDAWDAFVTEHPTGHLLQTWNWGELKARFGWRAVRLGLIEDGRILAGAQVLFRPISGLFSAAYVPKGPLLDWTNTAHTTALFDNLHRLCRSWRSIFLKIEPHAAAEDALRKRIIQHGFAVSRFTVQPPRTIVVDLTPAEDTILAAMKQKTRYNIRLAKRKGVTIREGSSDDLATFHQLMRITSQRDQFGIHSLDYFETAFALFAPDRATLLLAEVEGEPVAGLMVFAHKTTAYYLFGASSNAHREKMPTYLLQWQAMRWAKARGCQHYDLWGIPDTDEDTLEAEFAARQAAGLWGVYRFKRGFGGEIARSLGAFDTVYNRPLYWLYRAWMVHRQGDMT